MTGPEHLSARQQQALRALLEHPTIAAAAENCNLSERTLHRYLQDPDFGAVYREERRHLTDEVIAALQKSGTSAVAALRNALSNENAAVRVRAARAVLQYLFVGVELADLEERIKVLEEGNDTAW